MIEKILTSPLNCFDIPVQSHLLWQVQVYSRALQKVCTTTLSPVRGLGMCMVAWMSLWWLAVIIFCFPFLCSISFLPDTIISQQVARVHTTEEPCWQFCPIANPGYCYGYQAWMIRERLPALFCSHQTALGRSLFREFSQFPDCHWARGGQIKSYINMINSIVSSCILNAWGF